MWLDWGARMRMKRRVPFLTLFLTAILSLASSGGRAAEPGAIESDLVIAVQGEERHDC